MDQRDGPVVRRRTASRTWQVALRESLPVGTRSTGSCAGVRLPPGLHHAGARRAVAAEHGRRHDVPAERLGDDVRRDLAAGQRAVGEVPQRPLPRHRLVDARRCSRRRASRVPKNVALEAGMIRPWSSISPRLQQLVSSSTGPLMPRVGGGGPSEAVGARAQVPGRVERAAAERAGLAPGADDRLRALAERPGQAGRAAARRGPPPARAPRSPPRGCPAPRRVASLKGNTSTTMRSSAGVPRQRHRAGAELLDDRLLERPVVLERHRRRSPGWARRRRRRTSPRRAARRCARRAPRPAASPARRW